MGHDREYLARLRGASQLIHPCQTTPSDSPWLEEAACRGAAIDRFSLPEDTTRQEPSRPTAVSAH